MTPSDSSIESRLKFAIAEKMLKLPKHKAMNASSALSTAYRTHNAASVTGSDSNSLFLAYIAARFPATFAVVKRVLQEYLDLQGEPPESLLDIGAGPATASFAALDLFDSLNQITLLEKETSFQTLALELAKEAKIPQVLSANWILGDVSKAKEFKKTDLAIASYSLGEMSLENAKQVAQNAFACTKQGLIIIEPGTPKGFAFVREIRDHLKALGAFVAAPCSHQMACPMVSPDFCHFSERLVREKFHREAKNATLPYEDEKFSYVILTKTSLKPYFGRLIKRPIKGSGHVTLDICHEGKITRQVVARSNKEKYKSSRKAEWGDPIN